MNGRVALDVGVVCPQSASHRSSGARESLGAAEDYVRQKCSRADMAVRCRDAGVVFQPMIFESFGGASVEARGVIKSINRAVAENTDSSLSEVAQRFWWNLSVGVQKGLHRAFIKRCAGDEGCACGIGWGG